MLRDVRNYLLRLVVSKQLKKPYRSINKNSDFLYLKDKGIKFWASSWMLLSMDAAYNPDSPKSEIGFILSRKVGNAVTRNQVKRWLRAEISTFLKENPDVRVKFSVFIKPMSDGFYKKMSFDSFKKVLNNGIKFIYKKRPSKGNQ